MPLHNRILIARIRRHSPGGGRRFFSLPRGGAEIGGILLGGYEEGRLRITEYAPLECEHANGPSFTLSPRDLERLKSLIADSPANFPGCQVVGWYHSHTRSEIFLSDADLDIHTRFFPHPWQIALVMKPHTFQPARVGFFFRERGGTMHASESYREIVLEAQAVRPAPPIPANGPVAGTPRVPDAPRPASVELPRVVDAAPRAVADAPPPVETVKPADAVPLPVRFERAPVPPPPAPVVSAPVAAPSVIPAPVVPAPVAVKPDPPPLPQPELPEKPLSVPGFATEPAPRSRGWLKLAVAGLILGAAAAGVYVTQRTWLPKLMGAGTPPPAPSLRLHALDLEGQLQINWERTAPAVRKSTDGIMEIRDGDAPPQRIPLDAAHLANGIFTYVRQSDRVDLKLILRQASGAPVSEVTTFLGKMPEKRAPEPDAETKRQRNEAAKLQTDLTDQAARTRKLEKEVQSMRNEMKAQQQRRLLNQIPDASKK